MAKRGRKPKGPTAELSGQPLSLRIPKELREQLETSAENKGWSLSQEALYRIRASYNRERDESRDVAMRALCFLIAETAHQTVALHVHEDGGREQPLVNWRTDRFFYRAFKTALIKLLDALEPPGAIRAPDIKWPIFSEETLDHSDEANEEVRKFPKVNPMQAALAPAQFIESFKTPEARGAYAAAHVLTSLATIPQWSGKKRDEHRQWLAEMGVPSWLREFYGMPDAARDLAIAPSVNVSVPPTEAPAIERVLLRRKK